MEASQTETERGNRWVLAGIALLALVLRVPGVTRPLVGNFATKGAVYGMIARNQALGRAGLFEPTLDVLRGGQRSLHLLELPLSAWLTAAAWRTLGGDLATWGRATSIAWSLLSVLLMYRLVAGWYGARTGLWAAGILACAPVSIIFGQAFQLEASVVTLSLTTWLALDVWIQRRQSRWLATAAVCAAALFLSKVYMLVLALPMIAHLISSGQLSRRQLGLALAAGTLAVLPAIGWYGYAYFGAAGHFGLPVERLFYSVHESAGAHRFPHPLLFQAAFYKQLLDDLASVVLTPVGFGLLLAGLAVGVRRVEWLWLAATAVLIVLLPRKFHEMSYYWLPVVPIFCIVAARGAEAIYAALQPRRWAMTAILAVALVGSLRFAVGPAFRTPPEDAQVAAAGAAVERLASADDKVVTLHGTALDLLYYCNRAGWVFEKPERDPLARIEHYRQQGAAWLVLADLRQLDDSPALQATVDRFTLAASGSDFRVYRLDPARNAATHHAATGWKR